MTSRARRNQSRRSRTPRIPERFQTYRILAPVHSHHRRATCAEVDCPHYSRARCENAGCTRFHTGWRTILPVGSPLLQTARTSGRKFVEKPVDGGLVEFSFTAGQQCFAAPHWTPGVGACQVEHWVPLERQAIFVVNGARKIRFTRPEHWAEHWAEHEEKLSVQRERLVN